MTGTTNDFLRVVVEDIPLIDVRAPVEFDAGAIPGAMNLPILEDKERHLVGKCYKEKGRTEAINLGHRLVNGEIKQNRIQAWRDYLDRYPEALIYCFRGGMRSQLTQQWIKDETGASKNRLSGGYKAFRNFLLDQLNPVFFTSKPVVVGGRTGSGKTLLIKKLNNYIDLEAIANHRGSAFGRFITSQPSQAGFENRLAYALVKHSYCKKKYMVVEDEGTHIGRCYMPPKLVQHFGSGDFVLLEVSLEKRIQTIFDEYVLSSQGNFAGVYGEKNGLVRWLTEMKLSIERIKKRLGVERSRKVGELLESAFDKQQHTGGREDHKRWIEILLREYYDKMYDFQLKKNNRPLIFKGDGDEALEFLRSMR